MLHDIRKLCFDILKAITEFRDFTAGVDLDQYRRNRVVKLAVERDYEIIGEALKRLETRFQSEFLMITDGPKNN